MLLVSGTEEKEHKMNVLENQDVVGV